jgi:hypothetical protein
MPPRPAARLTVRQRIFRVLCAIKGHDMALHLERKSLRLRCLSCGSESRGWDLTLRRRAGARDVPAAEVRHRSAQPTRPPEIRRPVVDAVRPRTEASAAARRSA